MNNASFIIKGNCNPLVMTECSIVLLHPSNLKELLIIWISILK